MYRTARKVFRIDDCREGHNWSYMVSFDNKQGGLRLVPHVVYHFFGGPPQAHTYPRLTDFNDVVALMRHPSAFTIRDVGKFLRNPKAKRKFDIDNPDCVSVLDLGAIQRNIDAAPNQYTFK